MAISVPPPNAKPLTAAMTGMTSTLDEHSEYIPVDDYESFQDSINQEFAGIAPDSTVVFVMNHRSNMDYILVAFLAAEKTALSYAVGEWAKIWPLQTLIRAMGAYFVRRKSGNPLYRRVLERYIHMATKEGVCQAVFPEGGLSRDGCLGNPKLGVLDYMLRNFDPLSDRDIVFIPVGLNYDRTLEDRSLLRTLRKSDADAKKVSDELGRSVDVLLSYDKRIKAAQQVADRLYERWLEPVLKHQAR